MRYLATLFLTPLLLASLTSCLPEADEGLSLHDVSLYVAAESAATLYGYFYGPPTDVSVGGRALTLSEGRTDDPLAVPSALLVNGEPTLNQRLAPLNATPLNVQRTRFSTDLIVSANEDLGTVAYYDGSLWFTLTEAVSAGEERRVVPRERVSGLFGLGELTREEASAFERLLTERGPVVVAALPERRTGARNVGGLSEYRRTALFTQEGLETEMSSANQEGATEGSGSSDANESAETGLTWEELAKGSQASGGESPRFFVATSRAELENLWGLAYGGLLTPPEVPDVDFSTESVAGMFLGQRPTGGYSVDVQGVSLEDGEVYLQVDVTEPAQGAITTQALTNPWVMVRINQPDLSNAWFREVDSGELLGVARAGR